MRVLEQRVKLLVDLEEFSKFFKYHSEGRLLGSQSDLETDFESYFEGVGELDFRCCFGAAANELSESLALHFFRRDESQLIFELVLIPENVGF